MDIEKEISKALADPDLMNKVSSVLSAMGTDKENGQTLPVDKKSIGGLENILSALGSAPNDDRTRLLMAIKPFLSEKRAPYMDSAVTMLKLASIGKLGKDLKLF